MAGGDDRAKPVSLFYSYSRQDERLRVKLQRALVVLRRNGLIAEWHDRNIDAGDDWAKAIDRNLTSADIILLLVSADFLASDYCWGEEMTKALQRHERGETRVIPVILRPCRWMETPLKDMQAVPTNAKPVTLWANEDEAFDDVAAKITRVVREIHGRRTTAPVDPHPGPLPPAREGGARHEDAGRVREYRDLEVFRDVNALWCPEMVVIPAGEFLMGSPRHEDGTFGANGPQRQVTIAARFALGRYPVTFEEYDHFCNATRRRPPEDEGWGRGRRPVINVSWRDAVAYCEWLSKKTNQPCRLPSEAEWEYACRAGTTTRYAFGDLITPEDANYSDSIHDSTTKVGAYRANPWGLYDMHGDVWEWVEDVHSYFRDAPPNGTAWTGNEGKASSSNRVVRGGSWTSGAEDLRSACRNRGDPNLRVNSKGFRVARTLS